MEGGSDEAPTPDAAPTPEGAPVEAAADEEATTPEGPAPDAATEEAVAAAAEVPPVPPDESVAAISALPEAAPPRRHRLRRLLLGTLGLLIFLLLASGAGFGAAFLVPRFADASPVPSGASPSEAATVSPTPTTPPTTTPSATASASPGSSGSGRPSASPSGSPAPSPTTLTYVVQRGDTLAAIAARFGVSVQAIVAANGLSDPNHIETGQRLVIPRP
ncbi:MAG TPA: LysM domain-containing protein [Streptosporangiaceae bacterium]|nr:LysM domain-containing protein [Streptosporangiaceae bacterium]